jgi:hypothetical protein
LLGWRSGGVALIEPLADPVQVPWQELMNAFDRMIGDAFENGAQIVLGVETATLYLRNPEISGRFCP